MRRLLGSGVERELTPREDLMQTRKFDRTETQTAPAGGHACRSAERGPQQHEEQATDLEETEAGAA